MKKWITVPTAELDLIDLDQVLFDNIESIPTNLAGDISLVKYNGDLPSSVASIAVGDELTQEQAIQLLQSTEWSGPLWNMEVA